MNLTLKAWNDAPNEIAIAPLLDCCASREWAQQLVSMRPFQDMECLINAASQVWATMQEADLMQAFRAHPRIGERTHTQSTEQFITWSLKEQSSASDVAEETLQALRSGNILYEEQFGFTYIVCATGKSAGDMIDILNYRLSSNRQTELLEAAEQQRQITEIRLRKWLNI